MKTAKSMVIMVIFVAATVFAFSGAGYAQGDQQNSQHKKVLKKHKKHHKRRHHRKPPPIPPKKPSSIRYKTNVQTFTGGLDLVKQFRPVTYDLKADGTHDIGFIAEEVNKVEPLLTYNKNGRIEGIKYSQITTLLVNSINQQQKQIEEQQKTMEEQRKQIDALKNLICAQNATAEVCKKD